MNWFMQLAIALSMLTVAGGVSAYLANAKGKRSGGRLSGVLLIGLIGFIAWAYLTNRMEWHPGGKRVSDVQALSATDTSVLVAEVERLASASERLEAVAAQLDSGSFPVRLSGTMEAAVAICLIILTGGVVSYVHERMKRSQLPKKKAENLDARLGTLEGRVQDVQDVVLTLDDGLGKPTESVETPKDRG